MKETKGQTTQKRIVRAAISLISQVGIEKTTFATIGAQAQIKGPAILNYFKSKDEIVIGCIQYILRSNQEYLQKEISLQETGLLDLKVYARANIKWAIENQDEAYLILHLYSRSLSEAMFRSISDKVVSSARTRIRNILISIKREKPKAFDLERIDDLTRILHDYINGAILTVLVAGDTNKKSKLKEFEQRLDLLLSGLLKA